MDDAATDFSLPIEVRWADLDPNGHVRHSVYYDWGAQVRIAYLDRQGVGVSWMARNGIGPVLFREEAKFMRELRFGDSLRMDLRLSAASPDGRKWQMRHRLFRGGELAATLELDGAWLDLRARKVTVPPAEMAQAFERLGHSEDFKILAKPPSP